MKSLEKNKSALIALLIFAVAIIAYNYLSTGSAADEALGVTAQSIGNDVVTLSDELSRVDLTTTVFTTPAYESLTDYSPALPTESSGRVDPFAPIGQ